MKKTITDLIQIDVSMVTPVYRQIVQSICRNIENGILQKGNVLPSVNKIAEEFSLARGSVFTAYNDLRASGIIDSIPGKGYFVASTETKQHKRIFFIAGHLCTLPGYFIQFIIEQPFRKLHPGCLFSPAQYKNFRGFDSQ